MIEDVRAIAQSWPNLRMRAIADLAVTVTEAPWSLARRSLQSAFRAGLSDEDILHVVALSAYFGHLNRIADVVQAPLDYTVKVTPPRPDPSVAPWPTAPKLVVGRPAIDMARRPATANAFTEWKHYIFYSHDAPLTRRQRTFIARWVATWLGDGGISSPTDLTVNPVDDALRAIAETVTLAPWKITNESFAAAREAGFDDAMLFDVCATAASAGVFSRLEVALIALST